MRAKIRYNDAIARQACRIGCREKEFRIWEVHKWDIMSANERLDPMTREVCQSHLISADINHWSLYFFSLNFIIGVITTEYMGSPSTE